ANISVECKSAIASKRAPTLDGAVPQVLLSPLLPVGVSLLAMAVDQPTFLLNANPLSRAGSLPHWMGSSHRYCYRRRSL
ncbi:hypothetical protein FJD35_31080, partial [Pseudomonas mandelii]